MRKKFLNPALFITAVILFLCSCGSVKHADMLMLKDIQDKIAEIDSIPVLSIQPDDIISIQVSSRNPEALLAFQAARSESGGAGERALGVQEGYRVDEAGNIYLPYLGKIRAAKKTIIELRDEIWSKLVNYFPDATVQVRYLNFRVTLVGEVARPNAYVIPNERLNILEAIGMAGDFTPYARRNAVLVIRERNGIREFARINTQDTSLFMSPYFYLNPNDIVFVEPLKAKQYATRGDFFERYLPYVFSLFSIIALITVGR